MGATRRTSVLLLLAAATIWAGIAAPSPPAGAESTAPPTPGGVTVRSTGGTPVAVAFNGESGTLGGVTSSARAWATYSARRSGRRGLRLAGTRAPAYAHWGRGVVPQNRKYASVRTWVRVHTRRWGESVDLLTVANARSSRNFDFFVAGDTGRFKWDLYRYNSDQSHFVPAPGRWYLIEARISFRGSRHTAEVRIDGVHQGTVTSPGSDTTVRSMKVGAFPPKTHTQDYDDLALRVGYQPEWWVSNTVAGADVRWNRVVDSGSGMREYAIWRNGRWYGWVPAWSNRYIDTAPIAGARYQVQAVDRHGNRSRWSRAVSL